jgi:hypothetical protein
LILTQWMVPVWLAQHENFLLHHMYTDALEVQRSSGDTASLKPSYCIICIQMHWKFSVSLETQPFYFNLCELCSGDMRRTAAFSARLLQASFESPEHGDSRG